MSMTRALWVASSQSAAMSPSCLRWMLTTVVPIPLLTNTLATLTTVRKFLHILSHDQNFSMNFFLQGAQLVQKHVGKNAYVDQTSVREKIANTCS